MYDNVKIVIRVLSQNTKYAKNVWMHYDQAWPLLFEMEVPET